MPSIACEEYPIGLATLPLVGEDRTCYRERLLRDSSRLFKNDETDIEVLQSSEEDEHVQSFKLDHRAAVSDFLKKVEKMPKDLCYIFRQEFSWDQFSITLEVFQMLLGFHQVFAPFLDCVHSFGFRTGEDDGIWNGYRGSTQPVVEKQGSDTYYEFCYVIRYVARNGRSSGSPWSLRQTAVYQKYDSRSGKLIWIFLQPSIEIQRRYEEFQRLRLRLDHPMMFHIVLLFTAAADWKDYVDYLRKSLDGFDEKACFSRVGKQFQHDYTVTFEDSQRVQNLREKLLRTIVVLDAHLEVANGCEMHCRTLASSMLGPMGLNLSSELDAHSAQLRTHRRNVANILERSRGILDLLFKILEYRNDERFTRNVAALHKDVEILRDIAHHARREGEIMTKLTEQSRRDGRALKAFSVLGTLYLPVTLIAVCQKNKTIFSSSLIEPQPTNAPKIHTHFVFAHQFWLFIVLTAPLMLLTIGYMAWIEKR